MGNNFSSVVSNSSTTLPAKPLWYPQKKEQKKRISRTIQTYSPRWIEKGFLHWNNIKTVVVRSSIVASSYEVHHQCAKQEILQYVDPQKASFVDHIGNMSSEVEGVLMGTEAYTAWVNFTEDFVNIHGDERAALLVQNGDAGAALVLPNGDEGAALVLPNGTPADVAKFPHTPEEQHFCLKCKNKIEEVLDTGNAGRPVMSDCTYKDYLLAITPYLVTLFVMVMHLFSISAPMTARAFAKISFANIFRKL